jgi:hypothetical protein
MTKIFVQVVLASLHPWMGRPLICSSTDMVLEELEGVGTQQSDRQLGRQRCGRTALFKWLSGSLHIDDINCSN